MYMACPYLCVRTSPGAICIGMSAIRYIVSNGCADSSRGYLYDIYWCFSTGRRLAAACHCVRSTCARVGPECARFQSAPCTCCSCCPAEVPRVMSAHAARQPMRLMMDSSCINGAPTVHGLTE